MIDETILWSVVFVSLEMIRYFYCERHIIVRKGRVRLGYFLGVMLELCSIAVSYYLIHYRHLEKLGGIFIAIIVVTSITSDRRIRKIRKKQRAGIIRR